MGKKNYFSFQPQTRKYSKLFRNFIMPSNDHFKWWFLLTVQTILLHEEPVSLWESGQYVSAVQQGSGESVVTQVTKWFSMAESQRML